MIKSVKETDCFKSLSVELKNLNHAYLFYSNDSVLNNSIAMLFAMKIFCNNKIPCFECELCKKMLSNSNPDFIVLDKPSILVEDVMKILEDAELKPMLYSKKVILIKNAELINEVAQNKLLKTLEEPNSSTIFILTCTNEDKLLSTVQSRLKKFYLNLSSYDCLKEELLAMGIDDKFINKDFSLTEIINNSNNKEYISCIENVENLFLNLSSTKDIPGCVSNLKLSNTNKLIYIEIIFKLFNSLKGNNFMFSPKLISKLTNEYSLNLIVKVERFIDEASKQIKSNVNANYVFDCLLYSILKEKYLCKQ